MKIILLMSMFITFLLSCGGGNNQKTWVQEHKDNFMTACIQGLAGYTSISDSQRREYCSCSLGLMMKEFDSAEEMDKAALKWTYEEMMDRAKPCVDLLK